MIKLWMQERLLYLLYYYHSQLLVSLCLVQHASIMPHHSPHLTYLEKVCSIASDSLYPLQSGIASQSIATISWFHFGNMSITFLWQKWDSVVATIFSLDIKGKMYLNWFSKQSMACNVVHKSPLPMKNAKVAFKVLLNGVNVLIGYHLSHVT